MAKYTDAPVLEQTATTEIIATATRVFLGVAIGMGFIVSGVAFFIIPINWGGDRSAQSLKIVRVTDVKSIMNADEQFKPLNYFVGGIKAYTQTAALNGTPSTAGLAKNQPLKILLGTSSTSNTNSGGGATSFSIAPVNSATSFSVESIGGTTSFSIEPISPAGFPAQMVVLAYKLVSDPATTPSRMLTICIGRTSVTTLFVGTDGSTYANSSFGLLNGRTTNESCATIKNRAMKVAQVTSGTIVQQSGDYAVGDYVFLRAFMYVARFSNGQFNGGNIQPVTLQTEAPLYAGFGPTNFPIEKPAAPAIITLTEKTTSTQSITNTVCFPETTMNPATGGPVYYFDTTGTPFYDIFLQRRAMVSNCSDITAKALKFTRIDTGTIVNEGLAPSVDVNISRSNSTLARFLTGGTFSRDANSPLVYGGGDPLVIAPATYTMPGDNFTYPRSIITLAGTYMPTSEVTSNVPPTPVSATLCYPETTWTSGAPGARSWYFYDQDGNPYTDLFLAQPIACSSDGGGDVDSGEITPLR